jgi:putative phage-type endonuclease
MATVLELPNREAWLEERKLGLGASDVSAALGINPWKSPFSLWAEKCGLLPDEDLAAENEAVEWGLALEAPIARKFGERTGRIIELPETPTLAVHESLPFLRCTLDAVQRKREGGEPGDLQIKTTSAWNAAEWSGGAVPLCYQVQVAFELFVTGMAWGSIACLVGGQRLVWADIQRDDAFIEAALPHLQAFWDHVQDRTPPEVDSSPATAKVLQKLHPEDNGMTVELPGESAIWHASLTDAKDRIKQFEEIKTLNENRLKAALADASFGILPDGTGYSFKTQTRAAHEVKASTFRVLRRTK